MRTYIRIILIVLLAWFSLAVIGVSFGDTKLTLRDYDFTTILFFVIYAILVVLFFWKEKIFKYVLLVFTVLWLGGQAANYFKSPDGIAQYNNIFSDTHHIIPASDTIAVPDTYHLLLQILILLALVSLIAYCIQTRSKKAHT